MKGVRQERSWRGRTWILYQGSWEPFRGLEVFCSDGFRKVTDAVWLRSVARMKTGLSSGDQQYSPLILIQIKWM